MTCNGACGCSCKKEIEELKFLVLQSPCVVDVDERGSDADCVQSCIESGKCSCEMKDRFSDDDLRGHDVFDNLTIL